MSDKRSPRLATKSLSARGRSFNTSPVKFSNGTEGYYRSAINLVIRRQPSKETKDIAGYQQPRLLEVRNEPEIQVWTSELKEKHHRNKQNQNQQHRQKYHQKLEHEQLTRDTHFGHDHQCRHGPESRGYPKLRTTQHPKEDHGRKRSPAVIKGKVLLRVPSAYPVTDSLEVPGSQDSQDNDDSHRFVIKINYINVELLSSADVSHHNVMYSKEILYRHLSVSTNFRSNFRVFEDACGWILMYSKPLQ